MRRAVSKFLINRNLKKVENLNIRKNKREYPMYSECKKHFHPALIRTFHSAPYLVGQKNKNTDSIKLQFFHNFSIGICCKA